MPHVHLECLSCTVPTRDGRPRQVDRMLPHWLVPVLAIAFHADHEGHRMKVVIDGEEIYPGGEDAHDPSAVRESGQEVPRGADGA